MSIDPYKPAGFKFPTEKDYTVALGAALNDLQSQITASPGSAEDLLIPPLRVAAASLTATLESATNMPIAEIAGGMYGLLTAKSASAAVAAVGDLLDGAMEVYGSVAAATGLAASVPLVGFFVKIALMIAKAVAAGADMPAAIKAAKEECHKRACQQLQPSCQQKLQQIQQAMGIRETPADLFRPIAYAMARKDPLPPTPMSLYVALCGAETQGAFVKPTAYVLKALSIPPSTQRKMWSLIKGILAAIDSPLISAKPTAPGDGGRALFPLLQGIVYKQWLEGRIPHDKEDNSPWLEERSGEILSWVGSNFIKCPDLVPLQAAVYPKGACSCSEVIGSLVPAFHAGLVKFQTDTWAKYWDWEKERWKVTAPSDVTGKPARGVLVLSSEAAKKLASNMVAILDATQGERGASLFRIALGLGAGYGTYKIASMALARSKVAR